MALSGWKCQCMMMTKLHVNNISKTPCSFETVVTIYHSALVNFNPSEGKAKYFFFKFEISKLCTASF